MTAMPNGTVQLEIADGVATVTLDRPETLNSMNNDFMDDIRSAVLGAQADPTARVIVLTGRGRGFCSGADLSGVQASAEGADTGQGSATTDGMDNHFNPALRSIKESTIPVVARINGVAAGGGLGLALACDIAIAARSAFFVATFGPRLGIVPDLGATWTLPAKVGLTRAMAMAMLGERISAQQAAEWGMIYEAVEDDQLDTAVARVTEILKRTSGEAMSRIRSSIDSASTRLVQRTARCRTRSPSGAHPDEHVRGSRPAFMAKREPNFSR